MQGIGERRTVATAYMWLTAIGALLWLIAVTVSVPWPS